MGKFDHEEPVLALSTDKIEIEVLEGQDYSGEFVISSRNQVAVKGLVYSSNPHMECLTPQFKGEEVRIRYQFHSEGFAEGDIQKGDFYIICNHGEYNLSFVVSITKLYPETSIGKVRNLYDFSRLARENLQEAYKLFISSGFANLFRPEEVTERLLQEGLSRHSNSMSDMEEFLVAIKKKEGVRFQLEQTLYEFDQRMVSEKEVIPIKKNQWGYVEIEIRSDAPFLIPFQQKVTTEDFVGSVCMFEYLVDVSHLHAGNNYGRLILENAYQKESIEIVVYQKQKTDAGTKLYLEKQHARQELTGLYIDYRLKKIGNSMWAAKSIRVLNHLLALEPADSDWYKLMKAQAFLVSRQKQEAEWILDEFRNAQVDKKTPLYGYYLYLCTLAEREPSYVNRLSKQIEDIYHEQDESQLLFWVLLFVKEEYCSNYAARLHVLEQRVMDGAASPFFYMEAYYIYWQNPYLLTKLDRFEIQVLHWAAKRGVLTSDLAMVIMNLVGRIRSFSPLLYKILSFVYAQYENTQMLAAICSYLIRTQRFSPEYYHWYERGIEENLRIAGMNEAYLMSIDNQTVKTMPKIVQMYFQYDATLPYKQKAALLVNIIAGKEKDTDMYQSYRRIMSEFAIEQIKAGHMDDNLAILYAEMFDKGMIQKELVSSLATILYTQKMTVFGEMVRAYIIHRQLKEIQMVPIIRGVAYFQLYSKDYAIVLEDAYGKKYASGISYQLERLLNPGQYIRRCLECAPYETAFLLHYFGGRDKSIMFMPDDKDYLIQLIQSNKLRESFQMQLYPEVIRFMERMDEHELSERFLEQVPLDKCARDERIYLIEKLIEYHLYEKAYACIEKYGAGQLNAAKLVPICSFKIEEYEGEEDDFLINLTSYVFLQGKYNNIILEYLTKYYGGTTKSMKQLWQACYAFEIDTFELEERLIVQMLYTTEFVDSIEEIYENYCIHGGIEVIREAYLYYFAYLYLVKQVVVPDQIFPEIMQRIYEEREVPDVGRLALLAYFAEENEWTQDKIEVTMRLLEDYIQRGMYFAFYQQFPEKIRYHFHFYDKFFLEYRANPQKRVVLHYRMEQDSESYVNEEMNDVFEGIFVKSFTLFFAETVEYYITEEDGTRSEATESNRLTNCDVCNHTGTSRFEMMNAMLFAQSIGEDKELLTLMRDYDKHEKMNEKLFHMI
jgi:hypothetical protein